MSWFSRFFKSATTRAISKLILELTVMGLDPRVVRPLVMGLYSARDIAQELDKGRELRFLDKLLRYMGNPGRPETEPQVMPKT